MAASRRFQNRVIREGDQFSILIEVNGPGGFYTEIGRTFSMGKPSQVLQDAFGTAVEAQALSQKMMKPGVKPKELWDANNAFLEKRGYNRETRLYAHGRGTTLVERPAIRDDEPMTIQAGMNITIHPFAISKDVWAPVTDNYLVTENGDCVWIHTFPEKSSSFSGLLKNAHLLRFPCLLVDRQVHRRCDPLGYCSTLKDLTSQHF